MEKLEVIENACHYHEEFDDNVEVMKAVLQTLTRMQKCIASSLKATEHIEFASTLQHLKTHCDVIELTVMDEIERYE